jgi:hypothetical protein
VKKKFNKEGIIIDILVFVQDNAKYNDINLNLLTHFFFAALAFVGFLI